MSWIICLHQLTAIFFFFFSKFDRIYQCPYTEFSLFYKRADFERICDLAWNFSQIVSPFTTKLVRLCIHIWSTALFITWHLPRVDRWTLLDRSTMTRSRSVSYFWFSSSINSNELVRLKLSKRRVTCSLSRWGLSTNDLPINAAWIAESSSLESSLRPSRAYSILICMSVL